MMNKKKTGIIIGVVVAVVVIAVGIFMFIRNNNSTSKYGTSSGTQALEMITDVSGESSLDEMASVDDAIETDDPLSYLVENSTFTLDDEAIELYLATYVNEAETTAEATGVSVTTLIVDQWGYESVEDYENSVREVIVQFVKEQLIAYTIAKDEGIKITEEEFESLVDDYAVEYGFEDAEDFMYKCSVESIANAMLFDKVVDYLENL